MSNRPTTLYPASAKELTDFGQRLKDARLRRRFSMDTVCARADISRPTLYKIEHGDPSVSIGLYVQVLRVLSLLDDLSFLAKDDTLGRRLQDELLLSRKRAPRRKRPTGGSDEKS
ncbi:MAG: helix-turn-helix domain-containing protein [Chlorobiaceae bacterium]|nr:helix-turn-helix domain-containing protein [Chlorobiaceae bacterium]